MIGAGILGGVANFLDTRLEKERSKNEARWYFARCCALGLLGSFCVPLFLSIIQSDILERAKSGGTTLFVFLGFCVLAAFFSRRFVGSVYERVLKLEKEVQKTEQKTDKIMDVVEQHIDARTEESAESAPKVILGSPESTLPEITGKNRQVLEELLDDRFDYRSSEGIAKETNLDIAQVCLSLLWLKQNALANRKETKNGPRWYITAHGRTRLGAASRANKRPNIETTN